MNMKQMLAAASVVGTIIWLFPSQAKDMHAEQGSFGSGHAGGLSLQPQALIKSLQAQPEDGQAAQPSPPA